MNILSTQLDILGDIDARFRGAPIYDDGEHKFIWLGFEESSNEGVIQVNQYLIVHKDRAVLLDAGGVAAFPQVLANSSRYINIEKIDTLFYSHQDPDVSSGMALWMDVCKARAYIGQYWTQFVGHYGVKDLDRVVPIPDAGMRLELGGGDYIEFVPAHFLHSISNFHLYDSRSRILFSGDVGAMVFPSVKDRYILVKDFEAHKKLMEGFHRRFMASSSACKIWADRVSRMNIDAIAPQHGAIMHGDQVGQFFQWISSMKCGIELLNGN